MRNFNPNFKVGIDCRMISHSGIGIRLYHLLKEFTKIKDKPQIFLFGDPKLIDKYSEISIFPVVPYYAKIYSIKEFFGIREMNEMSILDIPHFNFPIRYINKCIVTVHDLTPYVMKKFFPSISKRIYLQLVMNFLRFSKKIISVSEFTKSDMNKYFPQINQDISVVYNAVDHQVFVPQKKSIIKSFKEKYNLPEEYFLTVGIGKEHKNLLFIINSLKPRYKNNHIQTPLLIAGTGGTLPIEIQNSIDGIEKFIFSVPFLEYDELPLLYAGAKCLIFPSLYEGFGLPLLEAQATGCPVLSSRASVMPEILQDSAIYFDPQDSLDFYDALQKFKVYSESLQEKGFINAGKFRWRDSADKILDIYYKISEDLFP